MTCIPAKSSEQLNKHVLEMARSEFIFKPMPLLQWFKEEIQDAYSEICNQLSVARIQELYEVLPATNERVLEMIQHEGDNLRADQQRVLNYLKVCVGNMNKNCLEKFLRFVTATTVNPLKPITVQFNCTVGLRRSPSASTCSSTLFLPTAYSSLTEFRKELHAILEQDESFEYGFL